MDILLIEDDAGRRVAMARHLGDAEHRVTIASSICEAREILHFIRRKGDAPQVILAGEALVDEEGVELRDDVACRFPDTSWIPLPLDLDLDWLAQWLRSLETRRSRARRGRRQLNILLVEADDGLRQAMTQHLARRGDCIRDHGSFAAASRALFEPGTDIDWRPHAIVSRVIVGGADGIGFYLAARRRFPEVRWIVAAPREAELRARSAFVTGHAILNATQELGRMRRPSVAVARNGISLTSSRK